MADEKVVITYETEYDGQGAVAASKGAQKVAKDAQKAGEAAQNAGAQGSSGFSSLATSVAKVGGAIIAAKGVIDFFTSSVQLAAENARSVDMLAAAYKNVGYTASGAMESAQKFASEMQRLTGLSDETFLNAQRTLANYKVVGTEAQDAIRAAYALSVNQGMSFENALQLITRAAVGNTSALSRYGIVLGENVKEGDKFAATIAKINEQFGASATASMGDTVTKTNALKESWGDLKEEIGKGLNEGLAPLVDFLTSSVEFLIKLFKAGGNYCDWLFGLIQTGIAGMRTAILGFAELASKSLSQIVSIGAKLHLIPQGVAEAVQGADDWLKKATQNAAQQTSILNRMRRDITDIWPEEKKISAEQEKQLSLNAAQINAQRQLNSEKKDKVQAEKEATKALEEQRKILDNMGLSSSKDLKGWNRGTEDSQQGPTDLEVFAGGENQLASAADSVMQYDAEAQRLEELRALKQQYIEQEITDEQLKQEALTNLNEQYATQKLANDKKTAQARQQVYASMWSALTGLASSENKKVAAVGKVASIAQATMSMFTGAAKALELPFPANLAAVATVLAQGAALVSQIESVKLANGGLVKAVTGGVNAVIGEGGSDEAVLPLDNTRAMRRIGGAIAEESGGLGSGAVITVNINATGGLIPFLDEMTEATQNGVSEALRYANIAVKVGNSQGGLSV